MFSSEVSTFLLSWRGFLLESRRYWHAHHRGAVVGTRSGHLLASSAQQHQQLTRVAYLVHNFFQRGATVWGFGFVNKKQHFVWGQLFNAWRPGVLSNYFFVRVRRVHFARRISQVIRVHHRGFLQSRQLRRRLTRRWVRLRRAGRLPVQAYRRGRFPAVLRAYATVAGRFSRYAFASVTTKQRNWQATTAWGASPHESRLRTHYLRTWWITAAKLTRAVRTTGPGRWFHSTGQTGLSRCGLRTMWATTVNARGRRRRSRVAFFNWTTWSTLRLSRPTWWATNLIHTYRRSQSACRGRRQPVTPKVLARHVGWPRHFPAAVAAGGLTLLGSNLVHEVHGGGIPFFHFGGLGFTTGATVWQVNWNQQPGSLHGVKQLFQLLWSVAQRNGTLRMVWRRLAV